MPTVLNVGAGESQEIPPWYAGWKNVRLDVDPSTGADIVCDARLLQERVPEGSCDAIYCSHNLEHYLPHDGARVLQGFLHVLKPEGFAEIRVPDIGETIRAVVQRGLDLEDELYNSPAGPIRVLDVLYGWQAEIARSGRDYYAHKTGFTLKSLVRALVHAGFREVFRLRTGVLFELHVVAFRQPPNDSQRGLFRTAV